jgi:Tfp pilus assembly protein PilF
LSPAARKLEASVIDPIHAQNHLRWGLELAQRGNYTAAKLHLSEALKRNPGATDAHAALQWLESRESSGVVDARSASP